MKVIFFCILRYIFEDKNTQDERERWKSLEELFSYLFFFPLALSACVATCEASVSKGGIHWASLENVWCFILVTIVAILLNARYKKQSRVRHLLVGTQFQFLRNYSSQRYMVKSIIMCIGVLFLCIALLRPQWNKSEEVIMQEGRDLYVALDISRSMLTTDYEPNRLKCAKEKIKRLVKKLSCERVGLILFSGTAFVQCPLTSDYSAFYLYLDSVDAELISSGTTALDQAIKQALVSFASVPERKSKLLVIFTDGEDFSQNLSGVKQEAKDANLSIFTIGVGTFEGAPVPLFDHNGNMMGHQKDAKGGVVISRLNESVLQTLSQDVGGKYIHATNNDDDIVTFVRALQAFNKEQISEQKIAHYEDQYHYFLFISFICFVLEWLL